MNTTFSQARMDFTKAAHLAAQSQFYAPMFPGAHVEFEDTVGTAHDLAYAIDCQLAVTVPAFRAPLRISVQERWRSPSEMRWGDVTITEWNLASDMPSELHKLAAQLFIYGFYDAARDLIIAAVAIDVADVQLGLTNGELRWQRMKRVDQTFIGIDNRDLEALGAVVYRKRP
jgi:hypothetical protein